MNTTPKSKYFFERATVFVAAVILAVFVALPALATSAPPPSPSVSAAKSAAPSQQLPPITLTPAAAPSATPALAATPSAASEAPPTLGAGGVSVINYALVDKTGEELMKVQNGQTFTLAVTILDTRLTQQKLGEFINQQEKVKGRPAVAITRDILRAAIRVRPVLGAFTVRSYDNIDCKIREDLGQGLAYTVVFHDITYNGGAGNLSFDISYVSPRVNAGSTEEPLPIPLHQQVLPVGQAMDNSVKPEVVVQGASYGGQSVVAGSSFVLTVSARNTGNIPIENVTVSAKLPESMSFSSGSGNVVIPKVAAGASITASFPITLKGDAAGGSVPVALEYSYYATVQGQKQPYTSSASTSVAIAQPERFEVTKFNVPPSVMAGEEAAISVSYTNKGKSILYNLTGTVIGGEKSGSEQFIGNMNPGTESTTDFFVTTKTSGTLSGKIVLSYEDASGNKKTIEKPFQLTVEEPAPIKPGPLKPEQEPKDQGGLPILLVLGVAAAAGAVFYRKKMKKKRLAELEDADI